MTWKVTEIRVTGIKGVLDKAGDFDLAKGKSIAIYAPNGCGKSGYADAVEYFFSPEGAVEHLGKGGADSERGGKHAIPHVLASERGIPSEVSLTFHNSDSGKKITACRPVKTGRSDSVPVEIAPILEVAPVHRVLRQHDLRRFVVDLEPGDKYSEISRWLGLKHLEQVLDHLTTTERALQKANPDREIEERLRDVSAHTSGQVIDSDSPAIWHWCAREATARLSNPISIACRDDMDTCIELLKRHRDHLILNSAAGELYSAKLTLHTRSRELLAENGRLDQCNAALAAAIAAEQVASQLGVVLRDSIFKTVWEAARNCLEVRITDECPVCLTPWTSTSVGSQERVVVHLTEQLEALQALSNAESTQRQACQRLTEVTSALAHDIREIQATASKLSLSDMLGPIGVAAEEAERLAAIEDIPSSVFPQYQSCYLLCRQLGQQVDDAASKAKIENIPNTAQDVEQTIEHIRALRDTLERLEQLKRECEEYRRVEESFACVAQLIQSKAASLVNGIMEALRSDVQAIYRKIHPTGAIPNVHIKPDTVSKTLLVRVDFHSVDRTVPPAGYLSEAQINTLGLALFVSSVRLFNRGFPFVFLDDIVSSYDADHRARIVDVIAEDLGDFQVFLTTHDERFYTMLKFRLASKGWQFDRITGWSFDQGPRRESDAIRPDQIDALIRSGNAQVAGNAVRTCMEEWLDEMCAKYCAYTLHKRGQKDYDRTLYDFWGPFVQRLKEIKGSFYNTRLAPQLCYQRLSGHALLNYYSHAQANPYEWPAMGDVEYVWAEFRQFQHLFRCYSCDTLLRYDHDASRLYCGCGHEIFEPTGTSTL